MATLSGKRYYSSFVLSKKNCDAFSFSPGVYVGNLNIIAMIPNPSFLTF